MPERQLANGFASDLDPLIVTSPIQRSGTTLLQRLLCSAPNTLIYGEGTAADLEFYLTVHAMKVQEYAMWGQVNEQKMERVLRGEVNDWILDLKPDAEGYLLALRKAAFAGAEYCRDFALSHGRPVWGFKHPALSPQTIKTLRRLMPRAHLLIILRELLPSLKSAKAQHMMDSEEQLRQLCQSWLNGLAYMKQLDGDPSVLCVRYEDLVEQPEKTMATIAAFSGANVMDRSVLEHKINIWPGREFAGQASDGYIPPAELTDRELRMIEGMTAPAGIPAPG